MKNYTTFAEIEALLKTAIGLPGRSVKDIAEATNIKPCNLYKWKTSSGHLSPSKADALLLYFMAIEFSRLQAADCLLRANIK